MSANIRQGEFFFDCIVEHRRSVPFGGRFAVILALLLLLIALFALVPTRRGIVPSAGEPNPIQAA